MEVTSTVEFVPPTVFKVDLEEQNRANEASGDVGDAEVHVHCSGVNTGVLLKIWLKQGKEKRLLARILKSLEKARKCLSRQNSTIKANQLQEL